MMDPRQLAVDRVLHDGGSIHVRAIRDDDKERLIDHFSHLSARSVYFRFFRAKRWLTDDEVRQFTELDFARHVGLVATLGSGRDEKIIGVGRYFRLDSPPSEPQRAEVAFAVADAHQGRGIATILLEHLAEIARSAGIEEFEADVRGENNSMLQVFASSGYGVRRSHADGVFHLTFPTERTDASLAAEHRRDRSASAASVRVFLEPHTVAVVGASDRPGSVGAAVIGNLVRAQFTGSIYPVHPQADRIADLPAFPTITAIGQPIDLAVVVVPAAQVEAVIDDCITAGVRGVVIISSGFAEASDAGRAAQRELTARIRAAGMRLVGPNCMGVLNTDPAVRLNATFAPQWPPPGNLAMVSQSGALGLALLDRVARSGVGVANFVSVGNKADVSSNDLLAYWADDPRTAVILLYTESFGNPRKFARVAPEVARRKPIVAVKAGRSAAGARAAATHSAALSSPDVAVDALFEQAGVIRTDTLEELLDVAELLSTQPVPAGGRVGVITNAGGLGILFADACEARGLTVADVDATTRSALRTVLPPHAGLANPIDVTAAAEPDMYARAIELVGADASVDTVVVIYIMPIATDPDPIIAAIARGAATIPTSKPVLTVIMNVERVPAALHTASRGRLPVYAYPEDAACALADVATILCAAGIRCAAAEEAAPGEVTAVAERLGYPLVAKAIAPGLLHKSDVGGVAIDLRSANDLAAAVARMRERIPQLTGVLLQRYVAGGIEALVGVANDSIFGPLIVCGLGGVLVELLRDVAYRLPPVTDVDANDMLDALRLAPLLAGYRGAPPGDRAALSDLIQRLSALVEVVPEVVALDLNPIKVLTPGEGVVVVDARLQLAR